MKPTNQVDLRHGDCVALMKLMPDNSVDSIVTDPPYELGFMGKSWDSTGIANSVEMWSQVLRVLKPGGHILAFSGSRTYHRMAVAIEDAGFQIRDQIMWVYGSGFPKSHDISKAIDKTEGYWRGRAGEVSTDNLAMSGANYERNPKGEPITAAAAAWQGFGTALKPAHEPIVLARKPFPKGYTVAQNVLEFGVGGLNIDASRVGNETLPQQTLGSAVYTDFASGGSTPEHTGRFPANLLFSHDERCVEVGTQTDSTSAGDRTATFGDEVKVSGGKKKDGWKGQEIIVPVFACVPGCPLRLLDNQSGTSKSVKSKMSLPKGHSFAGETYGKDGSANGSSVRVTSDAGGASRFFYSAKTSKTDRNEGLEGFIPKGKVFNGQSSKPANNARGSVEDKFSTLPQLNPHPTVKPTELMAYLCRLVTPPGGIVLDPFMGSGSTGKGAVRNEFNFIGLEQDADYVKIAKARIEFEVNRVSIKSIKSNKSNKKGNEDE